MINLWGSEPRSTYHDTCVRRVRKYLEKKCGQAVSEGKVVPGHITDAYGFNKKLKIIYLCEVKVRRSDLRRAPNQIYETALRFKRKRKDYNTVVPVIAVPARLQNFLIKQDNWEPLCLMCGNLGIAVWVIEQSTIREVLGPKIQKSVKASTTKKKSAPRRTIAKTRKVKKARTTKKKITRAKTTESKKRLTKSYKTKRPKTRGTKRKISKKRKATKGRES